MGIAEAIVVFAILWWLVFFAVLPWGIRSQVEAEEEWDVVPPPGTEKGAPLSHMLGYKALITTGITFVLWLAARAVIPMMMPQ